MTKKETYELAIRVHSRAICGIAYHKKAIEFYKKLLKKCNKKLDIKDNICYN